MMCEFHGYHLALLSLKKSAYHYCSTISPVSIRSNATSCHSTRRFAEIEILFYHNLIGVLILRFEEG